MARILITGGAGFIGINAADTFARQGAEVTLLDNFSRRGAPENVEWLHSQHKNVRVVRADIRSDRGILETEAARCDVILHLGAQVAVTTSVSDPRLDFDINALGTFNVLDAARKATKPPAVIYSSTNKVYGGMEEVKIIERNGRYAYESLGAGVSEAQPLDFHSPYGCSKGAADQYVRDFARIYGLRTVVFRQSCIYGPHQFGIEDQGWVAWFALRSLFSQPVTIYGDGKQVRDVLFVDDLVAAFNAAIQHVDRAAGRIYNIGGGPQNILSLLDLVAVLEKLGGQRMNISFGDWRPGDQRVYVSDIRRAKHELGWAPEVSPEEGVRRMRDWMLANRELIHAIYKG
jgi:CDP-paratose 2-epimerase